MSAADLAVLNLDHGAGGAGAERGQGPGVQCGVLQRAGQQARRTRGDICAEESLRRDGCDIDHVHATDARAGELVAHFAD